MNSDSGTNVKYIDGIHRRTKADRHLVQVKLPFEAPTKISVHRKTTQKTPESTNTVTPENFYSNAVAQLNGTLPRLSRRRNHSNDSVLNDATVHMFASQPTKPSFSFAAKRAAVSKKMNTMTTKASQLSSTVSTGAHKLVSKESFEQTAQKNPRVIRTIVLLDAVIIMLLIASVAALAVQYNNFRTESNNNIAAQKQQYEAKWQGLEKQWDCISNQWQQYKANPKATTNSVNGENTCQQ